jgi:hypothetical protein
MDHHIVEGHIHRVDDSFIEWEKTNHAQDLRHAYRADLRQHCSGRLLNPSVYETN